MTSTTCRATAVQRRAWDSSRPKQPFAVDEVLSTGRLSPAGTDQPSEVKRLFGQVAVVKGQLAGDQVAADQQVGAAGRQCPAVPTGTSGRPWILSRPNGSPSGCRAGRDHGAALMRRRDARSRSPVPPRQRPPASVQAPRGVRSALHRECQTRDSLQLKGTLLIQLIKPGQSWAKSRR
jgi:hypothetical protein